MTDETKPHEDHPETHLTGGGVADSPEARVQQYANQLKELQMQIETRNDELATAEAQRDEANMQLGAMENRLAAERMLAAAGAVDVESASLLLHQRVNFSEDLPPEQLERAVERLLQDKPFLQADATPSGTMPTITSSPRSGQLSEAGHLSQAAQRAAQSGNRRDITEYLRLRRQTLHTPNP